MCPGQDLAPELVSDGTPGNGLIKNGAGGFSGECGGADSACPLTCWQRAGRGAGCRHIGCCPVRGAAAAKAAAARGEPASGEAAREAA